MLIGEQLSGSSDPRLYFIKNEKRTCLVAQLSDFSQIIRIGTPDASLTLHRFNNYGACGRAYFAGKRFSVIERHKIKPFKYRNITFFNLILSRRG